MSVAALPNGIRRFALADIAAEPWHNGAGLTRQIAAGFAAGHSEWAWRASVADVARPGPFSVLAGIDRVSALFDLQPIQLQSATDELHFARMGDAHAYPGETPRQALLPSGPSKLFNLMTRRGSASARIGAHECEATLAVSPFAVVLIGRGCFRLSWQSAHRSASALVLQAGQGLLLDHLSSTLRAEILARDSCLLHAEIEPLDLRPGRLQSAVRG